ncbi:hypothetical protein DID76_03860 [Candidatus Marinamargulisbacteria bacterium SCGC AG-414-C22]|nr:hypothetical protein DID76_03860 [Candidatus Marinamargulisbacteria bacterium SCGC AG-414-C22]
MNKKQKKYTVYEIEKITKGKLSKYKLTKAINNGELKAELVKNDKKGRGVPNYFVYEEDLQVYVDKLEETRRSTIRIPDVLMNEPGGNFEQNTDVSSVIKETTESFKTQRDKLDELLTRIHFLEKENAKVYPILDRQQKLIEDEISKSEKRKKLIMELASNPELKAQKRSEILQKLNQLS